MTRNSENHPIGSPGFLTEHYSEEYKRSRSDSPDYSRITLAQRASEVIRTLNHNDIVVDIGSGPQAMIAQYARMFGKPDCRIITVDMARIWPSRLKATTRYNISHLRANGAALPLKTGAASLVLSNMALDFMPSNALQEVTRVLKPEALAVVNLHHPELIPSNLDEIVRFQKSMYSEQGLRVLKQMQYLRDGSILFQNEEEITQAFSHAGLTVLHTQAQHADDGSWWEVDARKAA